MSSIIGGYNYDIFISYRQKDNKCDRWVSEFVEALKTELESTFKEEISVYFDINPHDGLLRHMMFILNLIYFFVRVEFYVKIFDNFYLLLPFDY
jgi:hypothetical protein